MSASINRVVLVGNLTRNPELRVLPSGTNVCSMRIACNSGRRNPDSGEWTEKSNFFDVSVFGASAEACDRYLEKGRPVAVDGRLDWREWETEDGQRRQAVDVIADRVEFLGYRSDEATGETAVDEEVVAF